MKKPSEMTDREIQETQLANQRESLKKLRSINGWMLFFGIITIVSILILAFYLN